jgi:L-malate glycosyltransferase
VKILIFAHRLEVGGTQRNAIDLGVGLRKNHGHRVMIFAEPGPMAEVAKQSGLRVVYAPYANGIPSIQRMRALWSAIQSERPDLIHVWDWWQCLDAYYAAHLPLGIPMLMTDMMSDQYIRHLPKSLVTTYGTQEFVDLARAAGRKQAQLLVPPIDVNANAPEAVDPGPFRERYGIDSGDVAVVTVSRLVEELKGESLRRTAEAMRVLGRDLPVKLIIVGDGNIRSDLELQAAQINSKLGRSAVILTGELLDPRPAYACASFVVGMGGSALRGMAFGKPTIIVGARGFTAPFTPGTAEFFLYHGMFGTGDESASTDRLATHIRNLIVSDPDHLSALGEFSRQFVVDNFAVDKVCAQLDEYCHTAVALRRTLFVSAFDSIRTTAVFYSAKIAPQAIRQMIKKREKKNVLGADFENPANPRHCGGQYDSEGCL